MNYISDYKLEKYILKTKWEDLPDDVKVRSRVCMLDLITALILGVKGKQFRIGLEISKNYLGNGNIAIIGSRERFNLLGATIALSHASNSFDIDDGHNMIKGHPGTSFVPGLLAASVYENITYQDFLTTLVIGYDVAVRSGLAIQESYQYLHSTGSYGAIATAACMGRILSFDTAELNNALSIADFHAPLTPVMRSVQIPSMSKDGVPFGALVGVMAVLETMAGTTGKIHTLEEEKERYLLDNLGKEFEIRNLYFKPYTCCRWAHQPIRAILDMKTRCNWDKQDIEWVRIHTFLAATKLSKIIPKDTDEAQYNIAYPIACALVYGEVGFDQICDDALPDQCVTEMMERLEFIMDDLMEQQFPEKRLAWVEIKLRDGEILKSDVYSADGEAGDNIDEEWIRKKFIRITKPILGNRKQEEIINMILNGNDYERMRNIVDKINAILI